MNLPSKNLTYKTPFNKPNVYRKYFKLTVASYQCDDAVDLKIGEVSVYNGDEERVNQRSYSFCPFPG